MRALMGCDLLEKSYLCGINNNPFQTQKNHYSVVICLKNRTFVVLTTTTSETYIRSVQL